MKTKKYVFLALIVLAWATVSPFIAFRILCGSFVPKSDQTESNPSNSIPTLNEISLSEETAEDEGESAEQSTQFSKVELLTAHLISKTDYKEYSAECQKALAVAIRTQILFENQDREMIENYAEDIPQCVIETSGIIMTYGGDTINAVYHKSSYKTTASSQNGEEYLRSVSTDEDVEAIKKVFVFSKEDVKAVICELCPSAVWSDNTIISGIKYDAENRCKYISAGNCSISAEPISKRFSLPSLAFSVSEDEYNVIFTAYGEGDGVGMSLKGADALALQGKSYEEILKHYYTGIEIEKITQ